MSVLSIARRSVALAVAGLAIAGGSAHAQTRIEVQRLSPTISGEVPTALAGQQLSVALHRDLRDGTTGGVMQARIVASQTATVGPDGRFVATLTRPVLADGRDAIVLDLPGALPTVRVDQLEADGDVRPELVPSTITWGTDRLLVDCANGTPTGACSAVALRDAFGVSTPGVRNGSVWSVPLPATAPLALVERRTLAPGVALDLVRPLGPARGGDPGATPSLDPDAPRCTIFVADATLRCTGLHTDVDYQAGGTALVALVDRRTHQARLASVTAGAVIEVRGPDGAQVTTVRVLDVGETAAGGRRCPAGMWLGLATSSQDLTDTRLCPASGELGDDDDVRVLDELTGHLTASGFAPAMDTTPLRLGPQPGGGGGPSPGPAQQVPGAGAAAPANQVLAALDERGVLRAVARGRRHTVVVRIGRSGRGSGVAVVRIRGRRRVVSGPAERDGGGAVIRGSAGETVSVGSASVEVSAGGTVAREASDVQFSRNPVRSSTRLAAALARRLARTGRLNASIKALPIDRVEVLARSGRVRRNRTIILSPGRDGRLRLALPRLRRGSWNVRVRIHEALSDSTSASARGPGRR